MTTTDICDNCGHIEGWHHGKQKQVDNNGRKYIRTCFGIACTCEATFKENNQ